LVNSQLLINLASLVVALSSMIYELGLAQILSATLGGTSLRYAVTIGLFTATLGLGALAFDFIKTRFSREKMFPFFQNILAWTGFLSPFFLIEIKSDLWILNHLPIIVIGFLSGIELPLLMEASPEKSRNIVLAYDYVGMFSAAILFPLLLLPHLGVINAILVATFMNAVLGLIFLRGVRSGYLYFSLVTLIILDIFTFFYQKRVLIYATEAFI